MTQSLRQILVVESDAAECERIKAVLTQSLVFTAGDYEKAQLILDHQPRIRVLVANPAVGEGRLLPYSRRKRPDVRIVLLAEPCYLEAHGAEVQAAEPFRVLARPAEATVLADAVKEALDAPSPKPPPTVEQAGQAPVRERGESGQPPAPPRPDAANLELRDEWMRVVAHDIRSPLTIINGYANFLLENEPGLSEQGTNVVRRIHNTGQRLLTLLNSMLTLASLEEGKVHLECTPTRLCDVMTVVADSLHALADQNGITLEVAAPDEDRHYNLDRVKVEQVLQNLVANGIKFSGPGSTVRIAAEGRGREVRFAVSDEGSGLSADQAERVFDKFARYASAGQEGTGLGLSIAKALVELHGGRIWVESQPQQGATFRFYVYTQCGEPETEAPG